VIRHNSMMMSIGGEVPPGRGKGVDNISWADTNLNRPKNEENLYGQFSCYNWTVKIQSNNELI
jgi:hypothetical protein